MKHSSKGVLFFRIVIALTFLVGLSGGIGGCSGSSGGGPVSVNFIDGATGVSVDSSFRYTFTQFIDQSSVTGTSYFIVPATGAAADAVKSPVDPAICDSANALPASVRCPSPAACDLTPDSDLNYNTRYSICLTSDILYFNGKSFGGFMATFTAAARAITPAAPGIAAIKAALGANNANGMVPELALGGITLPVCTKADGSALDFPVTYSMTDLPAWLSFDAETRDVTLNGVATVPTDAYTASTVTYKCEDPTDATQFATISFTINDLDQGGVVDGHEYENGYVPLVNDQGSILLNPSNIVLYRGGISDFKVPTSIIITAVGMNPTDAADDTADFDGDTLTNLVEIDDETNIFVALSAGTFDAAANYGAGDFPYGITTGNFNVDGYLDIVVTNYLDIGTVSVLLSNGDGTFGAAVNYAVGARPYGITTGDFNGDGDLDLATGNYTDDNISVLIGNGDGTFGAVVNYGAGDGPRGITTGDFNGDGDLDLAVANYSIDNISVLLGNGDGTFGTAVNYPAADGSIDMTTGDFDGDGDLDLATANKNSNNVSVLLGNGDGTFIAVVNYAVGTTPYDITTGDFDGDGDLDLAATNYDTDNVSVLLGVGDGTFAAAVNYTVNDGPYDVTTGDFDGDGDLDLAAANYSTDNVSVLLGVGDGTFAAAVNYGAGNAPHGITTGDFNVDGDLDLAVINVLDDTVSVLLNQ